MEPNTNNVPEQQQPAVASALNRSLWPAVAEKLHSALGDHRLPDLVGVAGEDGQVAAVRREDAIAAVAQLRGPAAAEMVEELRTPPHVLWHVHTLVIVAGRVYVTTNDIRAAFGEGSRERN